MLKLKKKNNTCKLCKYSKPMNYYWWYMARDLHGYEILNANSTI